MKSIKEEAEMDSHADSISLSEWQEPDSITYGELSDWITRIELGYSEVSSHLLDEKIPTGPGSQLGSTLGSVIKSKMAARKLMAAAKSKTGSGSRRDSKL